MTVNSPIPATIALTAAVVTATVGVSTTWWPFLWFALLLALAGGSLLLWSRGSADRGAASLSGTTWTAEAPEPAPMRHDVPQEPPTPRRTHLTKVALPSAHREYDVLLSAVVCWYSDRETAPGTDGRAKTLILERAAELTRCDPPEEFELTRYRLAAELGQALRSAPDGIDVWADEVRLELRDEDAARLQRIRDFRKDEEIREYERAAERSLRDYLRSDMLADPGQAVLWWLARDPEGIHETVHEIGTLSRLSAAANGTDIPRIYRDLASGENGSGLPGSPWPTAPETRADSSDGNLPPLFFGNGLHDGAAPGTESDDGIGESQVRQDGTAAEAKGEDPQRAAEAFVDLLAEPGDSEKREVFLHIAVETLRDAGREDVARCLKPDLDVTGEETTERRADGHPPDSDRGGNALSQDDPGIGAARARSFRTGSGPVPEGYSASEAEERDTVNGSRAREDAAAWGDTSRASDPGNWFAPADWEADAAGGVSRIHPPPREPGAGAPADAEPGQAGHRDTAAGKPGSADIQDGEAAPDRP